MTKKNHKNILLLITSSLLCLLLLEFFFSHIFRASDKLNLLTGDFVLEKTDTNVYINKTNGLIYNKTTNLLNERYALFNTKLINKNKTWGYTRIAILGDSFTKGAGVENLKESYIFQLNKKIKQTNVNLEILPFADHGINTFQEYIILKDYILSFNPDLVILQFTTNDAEPATTPLLNKFAPGESNFYIAKDIKILQIKNRLLPAIPFLNENINRFLLSHSSLLRFISYKLNIIRINAKSDISSSMGYILKMKNLLKSKNISFMIFNLPLSYDGKYGNGCVHPITEKIKKTTQKANIKYTNICDYFDPTSYKSDWEPPNAGGHYNAKGYNLVSTIIYKAILNYLHTHNCPNCVSLRT